MRNLRCHGPIPKFESRIEFGQEVETVALSKLSKPRPLPVSNAIESQVPSRPPHDSRMQLVCSAAVKILSRLRLRPFRLLAVVATAAVTL